MITFRLGGTGHTPKSSGSHIGPMKQSRTTKMLQDIEKLLKESHIVDYEVSTEISRREVTVNIDPKDVRVYLPMSRMDSRYAIESWVYRNLTGVHVGSIEDRDMVTLCIGKDFQVKTFVDLIEFIINHEGYVVLLHDDEDNQYLYS